MRLSIELERLEIFLTVAEHRSFTRAAEMLYISHSTTSRSVAALEEALGVQLFYRDSRTVRLTPAGEVLYREGSRLVRRVENLEDMVRSAGLGFGRSLTVAVSRFSTPWLGGALRRFCAARPEVHVSLLHREPGEILKYVDAGEADIGVTAAGMLPENAVDVERLLIPCGELCLVVSRSDPLQSRERVAPADVEGRELVCDASLSRLIDPELRARNSVTLMPTLSSVFLRVGTGRAAAVIPAGIHAADISDWARPAMAWCVEQGILSGTTATTLSPQGTATRAQVATMLMQFVRAVGP